MPPFRKILIVVASLGGASFLWLFAGIDVFGGEGGDVVFGTGLGCFN